MEIKKIKTKQLCPHKLARMSLDTRQSRPQKSPPSKLSSSRSIEKTLIKELQSQNAKLKAENDIFQQYFATFEIRYKEQKRENKQLKKRVEELSRERDEHSSRKGESTYMLSERTIGQKISRATKQSRKTLPTDYF